MNAIGCGRGIGRPTIVVLSFLLCAGRAVAQEPGGAPPAFEWSPRAYVQLDWRGYPEWDVPTGTGRLSHDPFELRRARFGFDGRLRRVSYELTVDPQDEDGVFVKDAYGEMRFTRAFRIRIGQFKLPGSREYSVSARTTDFMERAAFADAAAAGRDIGGMATGEVGTRFDYAAGVFAGDGNGRRTRAGATGAGRVEFRLSRDLEIAASTSLGRMDAVDTEDPNSLIGRAGSGFRFFEQVYVDGWRTRAGGDVTWTPASWQIDGEFLRVDEQRSAQGLDFEDLPRLVSTGWALSVVREFGRPRRGRAWWRVFDVGGRVDFLGFDDSGPDTEFDSVRTRATDVRPRSVLTGTTGISMYPTSWTRVMTNAAWERYSETRSGPEPGKRGFWTLGLRLQVELP